jgi:hypothetical protein
VVLTPSAELSAHERECRREAAGGEYHSGIPCLELLRGAPEGGDEPCVAFVELSTDLLAHGVEQGRRRSLQLSGSGVRVLRSDCGHAERPASGPGSASSGFGFDLVDELRDPAPVGFRGEVLPAGQGRERDRLDGGILQPVEGFASPACGVLLGAIEPEAFEVSAVQHGSHRVDPGQIAELRDEVLFDAVGEHISQAVDLCSLLITDDDGLIAPGPNLLPPACEPADLAGQVGVEIAHKTAELSGVVYIEQQVEVGGEEGEGADPDRVALLGSSEHAKDELVELSAGPEQEAALEGSAGDLDQGTAVWDEAESSAHNPV